MKLILIIWIYICNILDYAITVHGLKTGELIEANPLMNVVLTEYPIIGLIYKVIIVAIALYCIYRFREHDVSKVGIYMLSFIYTMLLIYEVINLIFI